MPRDCFVIMPFSNTASCTEDEWTEIFEKFLKPAVEGAGLDYVCRRSVATRGNIVGAILQDLNNSHVVLADLTDRNANVFYELGVRHATKDRTLLIAQKREDIPFDLQAYAYHVYGWRTEDERKALGDRLRHLLQEIDSNPNRPDNPVSDFLRVRRPVEAQLADTRVAPSDVAVAQPLAGLASEGIDPLKLVGNLAARNRPQDAKTIFTLTKAELLPLMEKTLKDLNGKGAGGSVTREKLYDKAMEYISVVEPIVGPIEQFGLASTRERWMPGLDTLLRLAGNLITLSERPRPGQTLRFAQGAPSLMSWRMVSMSGAKALEDEAFEELAFILREPIEVEETSGKFSNRPFVERRDLFYPEAFLGYADNPMKYVSELWSRTKHIQSYFDSNESYQMAMAKFFILVALAAKPNEMGSTLYPGYRLIPQARRAMSALTSRLFSSPKYVENVAGAIGETGAEFKERWADRVQKMNGISSGEFHPWRDDVPFPAEFGEESR
jgi:hypothetical protein